MTMSSSLFHLTLLSSPIPTKLVCFSAQNNSHASKSPLPRLESKGCKLVGCGSAVPRLEITNDDLAKVVDTSDEWISVRTGIRKRRVLSGGESLTSLAVEAARKAIEMAKVDPNDVDLILVCSSTPDDLFGTGPQISKQLGSKSNPLAYNITAACSGFILGLISAASHIRGAGFQNVLVIGADAVSRHVDWTDRSSCIIFGDAAGAVLLQACNCEEDGLFGFDLHSDGDGYRHITAACKEEGATKAQDSNEGVLDFPPKKHSYSYIQMNGQEVFRFAIRSVPQSIESALEKANLSASNIDWLVLHQANQRIIDAVANKLELPSEKVISNLANYGNTSSASIPLALDESVRSGKIKAGQIIAASGFGAGLTWGSAIFQWG
ncbi:beta-ketoacyl-[acyl-carrier-protein] synthase III A, chloroplastic-like [Cicer arietinum]|uniref:beta-ketoacyl-[acyl-carrier-protein] synthase III n=1 Tax=Cicer arietinum TaxID=3827 RepID=A0A1S2YMP0_CICAR|nr:3-oxoacyl-[acyl-carrier-protein] synthase 3 A, chloroplastic-like [Cicer arietinum]